jgi:hypothetical protein
MPPGPVRKYGPGGAIDVLEFYETVMVEPIFCYRRFVWMSKPFVWVVLFYFGLSLLPVRGVGIRPMRDEYYHRFWFG